MPELSPEQIEADETLCIQATHGPWFVGIARGPKYEILEHTHGMVAFAGDVYADNGPVDEDGYHIDPAFADVSEQRVATARFLMRARVALPQYIDALRKVEKRSVGAMTEEEESVIAQAISMCESMPSELDRPQMEKLRNAVDKLMETRAVAPHAE